MSAAERRPAPILRRLTFLLALLLFARLFALTAIPSAADGRTTVYRAEGETGKKIALTFDDGPHPVLTPKILKILEKYGVRATFFMVGENIRYYREAAEAVRDAGHEIGNHTFSHLCAKRERRETYAADVRRCEDELETLLGYRPNLLRPPEGAIEPWMRTESAAGDDYTLVLWSVDTRDWECKDADRIVKTILDCVSPGDVILCHDFIGKGSRTPEALERVIPALLKRGYEFVTVSELLGRQ